MSKTQIVIWWDKQDPTNHGWACAMSRDDGDGYDAIFSRAVDADEGATLQEVIEEALTDTRGVPAAALDAANWARDPDGFTFSGEGRSTS